MSPELETAKRRRTRVQQKKKGLDPEEAKEFRQQEERANLELIEFVRAIDGFKRKTLKLFLTWSEVLEILRSLGYKKAVK